MAGAEYAINGYLYLPGTGCVASAANFSHLTVGLHHVNLDFNGSIISFNRYNGTFNLSICAYLEKELLNWKEDAYTTHEYNWTQFEFRDLGPHDGAVTQITTSKSVVCEGFCMQIDVEVSNFGVTYQTFNLSLYPHVVSFVYLSHFSL